MQPRSHGAADLQLVNSPALLEGERSVQNRAGKCISTGQGVKTEDEVLRSPGPPEMHFCAILVRLVLMMLILPRADDGRLTARRGLQRLCRSSAGSRIAPRAPPRPRRLPARRCSPDASLLARCCSSDAERRVCCLVRFFSGSVMLVISVILAIPSSPCPPAAAHPTLGQGSTLRAFFLVQSCPSFLSFWSFPSLPLCTLQRPTRGRMTEMTDSPTFAHRAPLICRPADGSPGSADAHRLKRASAGRPGPWTPATARPLMLIRPPADAHDAHPAPLTLIRRPANGPLMALRGSADAHLTHGCAQAAPGLIRRPRSAHRTPAPGPCAPFSGSVTPVILVISVTRCCSSDARVF